MSLPQLDLLRGARVVGGERRRPRLLHCHGAEAARVSAEEEKGGGEREASGGGGPYPPEGGARREEERGEGTGARRPWRQCSPWRHSDGREMTGGSHLSGPFLFPVFQNFQQGFAFN